MQTIVPSLRARISKEHLIAAAAIVATIAAGFLVLKNYAFIQSLGRYGYFGAWLASALAGATVIIPIPGLALVFALGGVLNPVWLGLVAGLGEAVGGTAIYITGMSGRSTFQYRFPKMYPRVSDWMKRRGPITVFLYSAVFNPLFYPLTLACGALRFGLVRFFFLCWAGKTVKCLAVAYAGYFGLRWLIGT